MSSAANTPGWRGSTLAIALFGSLLMWASLPPLAWGWLGWIAPVPWLLLVRMSRLPECGPMRLPRFAGAILLLASASGRRPYLALYLAGLAFWLASIYWICLPHPVLCIGWFALSAYLAIYVPIFVGLTRVAVHRCSIPLWLAAPVVWTGLELARAHVLTGFMMASLAHSQVNWTMLIQISDLVGEYGVDFVMVLFAACITCQIPSSFFTASNGLDQEAVSVFSRLAAVATTLAILAATLFYGHSRLATTPPLDPSSGVQRPRLALIQGNSSPDMKFDPNSERKIMNDYIELSEKAIAKARQVGDGRPVTLVVWPETMFRTALYTFDKGYQAPPDAPHTPEEIASYGPNDLAALVKRLGTPVLVGVDRVHYPAAGADERALPPRVFNSAVLVGHQGEIIGTYDKMHRVMFGEYIPFADWFPFLYTITPLTGGIAAGEAPAALRLNRVYSFSPSICYETAIPHVIRHQVAAIENRDVFPTTPTALINVTNDSWYHGSSELDMHLACAVFRAVEVRLPLVIAANDGISAWIDHFGNVRAKLPKQQADSIIADIEPSGLRSYYVRYGDWFAALWLACCIVLAAIGWKSRRNLRTVIEVQA